MAFIYDEPSYTFSEYLFIPGLTKKDCTPDNVSLRTPLVRFKQGEKSPLSINIPLVSAVMQAVSDDKMAVALAKCGGLSFIFVSQPIDSQAEMISRVKKYKSGFVISDSNLKPDDTLEDVLRLKNENGHSTIAVTDDGTAHGRLMGIVTSRDYRVSRMELSLKVKEFMTPFDNLVCGDENVSLKTANDIIWDHKLNCLPIIDSEQKLKYFVFRKDYIAHKEYPDELLDEGKRYVVGAGVNTRDYEERIPALVEAGADILCIDSSEGFTEWQSRTIDFVRKNPCYGSLASPSWPDKKIGMRNLPIL